jgi:hypothetical protein
MSTNETPQAHGESWRLYQDRFSRGTALGPVQIQVTYRPESLPEPWQSEDRPLALLAGGTAEATPSDWDATHFSVTTRGPVAATAWSLQAGPSTLAAPELTWARTSDLRIRLSWKSAAAVTLEGAPALGPNTVWATMEGAVSTPDGLQSVTLETTPGARFFRLRAAP